MPSFCRRHFHVVLFCLSLAACTPSSPLTPGASGRGAAASPAGDWHDEEGNHFSLDSDNALSLPGQSARSGLTWSRQGDVLTLRTLDIPGGTPREDRLILSRLGASRLELRDMDGKIVVWRRARGVRRLSGSFYLPEDAVLPPLVTVEARLFAGDGGTPVASALLRTSGRKELPFRLHYLADAISEDAAIRLDAAVFHANEKLFATDGPVFLQPAMPFSVPLSRPLPDRATPPDMPVPSCFTGAKTGPGGEIRLTLHLEPDGFYLLERAGGGVSPASGAITDMGRWHQVDRNHVLELGRGARPPLRATLRPAKSLLLADTGLPGGEMELKPASLPFPAAAFPMTGMFTVEKGRAITECSSGLDFTLQASGEAYSAMILACREDPARPCLVEYEATILRATEEPSLPDERNPAGRGLEMQRLLSARPGGICAGPHASVPLEQTYWRLTKLNGETARTFPGQSEPHLILRPQEPAVGSDGCNNFFLPWSRSGDRLRFEQGGSTLMFCRQGGEQAGAMLEALRGAEEWSISGSILELRAAGRATAVFEAVDI